MNTHITAGLHALELAFSKQTAERIQLYVATLTRKGTTPEGMKRAVESSLEHLDRFPSIKQILEFANPPEHERSKAVTGLRDMPFEKHMPDPATRDPEEVAGTFVARTGNISKLDGLDYTWGDLVGNPNRVAMAACMDEPAYLTRYGNRYIGEDAKRTFESRMGKSALNALR